MHIQDRSEPQLLSVDDFTAMKLKTFMVFDQEHCFNCDITVNLSALPV